MRRVDIEFHQSLWDILRKEWWKEDPVTGKNNILRFRIFNYVWQRLPFDSTQDTIIY